MLSITREHNCNMIGQEESNVITLYIALYKLSKQI